MGNWRSGKGTSLIETAIALGVLSVGSLGMAAVFTQGMERTKSSPNDLIASQKAVEAIESMFAARDSDVITWAQLRNVSGSGGDGGVIIDGPQDVREAGPDGIVNTADDAAQPIETIRYSGRDQIQGNADDPTVTLAGFTREVQIRNVSGDLRSVTVIVKYRSGAVVRTNTLVAYISDYN